MLETKETIHIISLEPISKKWAPKSIHELSVVSVWMNVIGRELIRIVWLGSRFLQDILVIIILLFIQSNHLQQKKDPSFYLLNSI